MTHLRSRFRPKWTSLDICRTFLFRLFSSSLFGDTSKLQPIRLICCFFPLLIRHCKRYRNRSRYFVFVPVVAMAIKIGHKCTRNKASNKRARHLRWKCNKCANILFPVKCFIRVAIRFKLYSTFEDYV